MNTIQKIIDILMKPNTTLTNIIILPFFVIEVYLYVNLFITLLNINPSAEAISLPLYHILFLVIVYALLFILWQLFKHFKLNITLFTNLNKKDSLSILSTVILGFITIFLQLYITAFYNNILPGIIILLSIMCLVAYFFVSVFNIVKTKQLEVANRDIKNLKLYNNTLKIMYDNIRAFKHDFHNIMNGIGRIYNSK